MEQVFGWRKAFDIRNLFYVLYLLMDGNGTEGKENWVEGAPPQMVGINIGVSATRE